MILKRLYRAYGYVNQPLLLFRFRYISILVRLTIAVKDSSRFLLSTLFYFVALPRVHLDYRILCKWIYMAFVYFRVSSCPRRIGWNQRSELYTRADMLMNLFSTMKRQTVLIAAPGYVEIAASLVGSSVSSLPRYLMMKPHR